MVRVEGEREKLVFGGGGDKLVLGEILVLSLFPPPPPPPLKEKNKPWCVCGLPVAVFGVWLRELLPGYTRVKVLYHGSANLP